MQCSATDSRDKIFAIASLLRPEVRGLISIDYSTRLKEIFQDAVTACIADCGDLDILCFASLSPDREVKTTPNFTIAHFQAFLARRVNGPDKRYRPSLTKAWVPHIALKTRDKSYDSPSAYVVTSTGYQETECKRVRLAETTTTERLDGTTPVKQLLPRLHVRAHLIDISTGSAQLKTAQLPAYAEAYLVNIEHLDAELDDEASYTKDMTARPDSLALKRWQWLVNYLSKPFDDFVTHEPEPKSARQSASRARLPHTRANTDNIAAKTSPGNHVAAVGDSVQDDFEMDAALARQYFIRDAQTPFRTDYSMGFSSSWTLHGDAIFAIDGVQHPMVLREIGPNEYRIVGVCYLWAAMEAQKSGSRGSDGIWGQEANNLGSQRTRFIEVY